MSLTSAIGGVVRFADYEVDLRDQTISRNGAPVSIQDKPLQFLLALLERPGQLVSRDELRIRLWPSDTFGAFEDGLNTAVRKLRIALNDSAETPQFIETVPRRGYRFIAPVEQAPAPALPLTTPEPNALPPIGSAPPSRPNRQTLILATTATVIVVASGVAAWRLYSKPTSEPPLVSNPVPLTTYRGSEDAPSFSPDGNQIAFEWNSEKQDKFDIYVKVVGSDSPPLRLTSDPNPSRWPSWSPDGRTIAFERIVSPGTLYLMMIPALGGPERKLAELHFGSDLSLGGYTPAWSANSKLLVVPAVIGPNPHLIRVSVETGESTPITDPPASHADTYPAISPDGKTLVFVRHGAFNAGNLYTMQIDADVKPIGSPSQLMLGESYCQSRLTADGKEIVTHVAGESAYSAVRVPVDGSTPPRRIPSMNSYGLFDIARKGNRLAFAFLHGDTNIWRIDLTAKLLHPQPFIASTVRDVFPQYSPDGRRLAFHSNRGGTGLQVWVTDSEGNQARQLTDMHPGLTGSPQWSPDGQTLAFNSNSTGHYQIYTMSADGGKMVQRTHGAYDSFGATWSRDGRWLYFTSTQTGRGELLKIPVGGGEPIPVTQNGGSMAIESQDGSTLYYSKEGDNGSIWKMPIGGGPEQQLTDSLYRTNFAVTKTGIYFMTAPHVDGTSELRFYNFATGAIKTLIPIGLPEYGLAVSPDERYLIYDQLDDLASDLMLVENFR